MDTRSSKSSHGIKRVSRAMLAFALAATTVLSVCGCRPTDFFTEVVISPYAEEVDYDNPLVERVNSPDADEESSALAALDWADDAEKTYDVQKLVVYGSNPNTDLTTRHSIFDLDPRFPGIEASDGVRLVFDEEADIDQQVQASEQEQQPEEAESVSQGGESESSEMEAPAQAQSATDNADVIQGDSGMQQEDAGGAMAPTETPNSGVNPEESENPSGNGGDGDQSGQDEPGGNPDGEIDNPENPGSGEEPTPEKPSGGETPDPYGGYSGSVPEYNPGDAFDEVQHANHIAVLGTEPAIMAQSLGGSGAICAMSENAYLGLDSAGKPLGTVSNFAEVFAGEVRDADGNPVIAIAWSNDGSSPSNLADVSVLVEACGKNGVIVYDQRLGNQETLFTDEQRRELYAANIQLVPVDPSTVQGILDMARVIGDALSESNECSLDAKKMSDDYISAVDSIVRASAATHGGWCAEYGTVSSGKLLTRYDTCPIGSAQISNIECFIAIDSETGLRYTGEYDVDASGICLFASNGNWQDTPLYFWQQAAGVRPAVESADWSYRGIALIWPLRMISPELDGGSATGPYGQWLSGDQAGNYMYMNYFDPSEPNSSFFTAYGLGSAHIPYLIVTASGGMSSFEVKNALVQSMRSYDSGGPVTPYSVLPYQGGRGSSPGLESPLVSTIGSSDGPGSALEESPFLPAGGGVSLDDTVRQNPSGLLGLWTEGSMESVLEAAWLSELYSTSPSGSTYEPLNDMSDYSVNIGGLECSDVQSTVLAFYKYFYHLEGSNIDDVYPNIVPECGV